jgi:hydroxypyruvate isomerase
VAAGENGLAALPGRKSEARAAIDQAVTYASAVGAGNVHVMAGVAQGAEAEAMFLENLGYACEIAAANGITILIEPLNHTDAPGYFLQMTGQAEALIARVGAKNLKLMFDCYHVHLMEGDVMQRLERLMPVIGHIQFASTPDRGAPDHGDLNYDRVFRRIAALGYDAPLGAEYKPGGPTEDSLGWMKAMR